MRGTTKLAPAPQSNRSLHDLAFVGLQELQADLAALLAVWTGLVMGVGATVGGALPENAMEWVDIATDQIGFPDGDEGGPAAAPSLRPSGCRAPGRDRPAWSPVERCRFLPGPRKIRRCASPTRIVASAVGSTPLRCRALYCPKTERAHRPVPSTRRHKRATTRLTAPERVLEVRIHLPPAVSPRTFGSGRGLPLGCGPTTQRVRGDVEPAAGLGTARTNQVNSVFNNWRFEDVWLDR
jgi:hypothetical protein